MTTSHLTPAQRHILGLADEHLTDDFKDRVAKTAARIAAANGTTVIEEYVAILSKYVPVAA